MTHDPTPVNETTPALTVHTEVPPPSTLYTTGLPDAPPLEVSVYVGPLTRAAGVGEVIDKL